MKATPETPLDDLRERSIVPPFDVVLHDGIWYVTAHAGRVDDTPRTILRFVDEVQLGARGNSGAIRRLVELLNLGAEVTQNASPLTESKVAEVRSSPLPEAEQPSDTRAVSVRFIGWMPRGRRVVDVDRHKVTEQLRRVFGFTHITRLAITDQTPAPEYAPGPDPAYDHQTETC